eukprot:CAMPEP_0172555128 /NCGR_PEP_ID=MMETSP1067-20121228/58077_1 /TAXON_ID=265564 ORGANISM="Thalassiosira punctigera, Strain Tpunct2005C2" /NCGR_SAMPLE_ID=MMETSP1067 /ASSEMBLY_ACC=CAM_ASM_000444 /LENGTH=433 /DNA_ID=CAMNT_0013343637 /DNA_START=272 /DNA_END=1573 /DNA_ORIENTATION=-
MFTVTLISRAFPFEYVAIGQGTEVARPRGSGLPRKPEYRVLMTDLFFPIASSKWRLEEIYSFMDEYYTDIIVDRFMGPTFHPPTYEKIEQRFMLSERYDILIFDPQYNFLDVHNRDFNGTAFNGAVKASYLLRRKEFRSETIDFGKYDLCYHIFLMLQGRFSWLPIPLHNQWIHLYPGGGLASVSQIDAIPSEFGLVINLPAIWEYVQRKQFSHRVAFALGGPFLQRDSVAITKQMKRPNEKIGICFTQSSDDPNKGSAYFEAAMRNFSLSPLQNRTIFYQVGNAPINAEGLDVVRLNHMSQADLDAFYREHVDIYVNTENGRNFNGFPLGIEALLQGAVGITTDPLNAHPYWNLTEDEIIIIPTFEEGVPHIVQALKKLTLNLDLLHSMSLKSQKKFHHILSFANHQAVVFEILEQNMNPWNNRSSGFEKDG